MTSTAEAPAPNAEQHRAPERQEAVRAPKASDQLVAQLALGNFKKDARAADIQQAVDAQKPREVHKDTYKALKARHNAQREADRDAFRQQLHRKGENVDDMDAAEFRHHHMTEWASRETQGIMLHLSSLSDNNEQTQAFVTAMGKLGFNFSGGEDSLQAHMYDGDSKKEGDFYTNYCKGDTNQQLATALNVQDMLAAKPFLVRLLGSAEAFDALVALRQTQDRLKEDTPLSPATNALQSEENKILDFLAHGLTKAQEEEQVRHQSTDEARGTRDTTGRVELPFTISPAERTLYENYASVESAILRELNYRDPETKVRKKAEDVRGSIRELFKEYGAAQLASALSDADIQRHLSSGPGGIEELAKTIVLGKEIQAERGQQQQIISQGSQSIKRTSDSLRQMQSQPAEAIKERLQPTQNVGADLATLERFSRNTELQSADVYRASVDRATRVLTKEDGTPKEGIAMLNNVPTIVLSDLHARRDFLYSVMHGKMSIEGQPEQRVYDLLKAGKINVVCVGDGLHSERDTNWDLNSYILWETDEEGYIKRDAAGKAIRSEYGVLQDNIGDAERVVRSSLQGEYYRKTYESEDPGITDILLVHWSKRTPEQIQRVDALVTRHGMNHTKDLIPENLQQRIETQVDQAATVVDTKQRFEAKRNSMDFKKIQEEIMQKEITRSLGLMKMVMDLKAVFPDNFHFIRGNHDDMLGAIKHQAKHANESIDMNEWIKRHFGDDFLQAWGRFEAALPLMAVGKDSQGHALVVSHTVPTHEYSIDDIKKRTDRALLTDFTWTDNREPSKAADITSALEKIRQDLGLPQNTVWVIGHRPTELGKKYRKQQFGGTTVIQINDDINRVFAVVPGGGQGGTFDPDRNIYLFPRT